MIKRLIVLVLFPTLVLAQPQGGAFLNSARDSVAAVQSGSWTNACTQSGTWILGANSGVDIGDVTINNSSGASAVNIQDGGNSITIDNSDLAALGLTVSTINSSVSGRGITMVGSQSGTARIVRVGAGGELVIDVTTLGGATAANQTTAQTTLTSIDNYLKNYSGTPGSGVPVNVAMMGGNDGGTVTRVATDANGELQVDVLTLPTVTTGAPSALGAVTHSTLGVTTASQTALSSNGSRRFAYLQNDSDTTIYCFLGTPAVANTGIRLNAAGGYFEINDTNRYTGQITCIHGGSGTKTLLIGTAN